MFSKLKEFKDLRDQGKKLQEALGGESVTTTAVGDKVVVSINGNLEITALAIDDELLNPSMKEKLQNGIKEAHAEGLKKMGVELKFQHLGDYWVRADKEQLIQVILNLVLNAIDAKDEEKKILKKESPYIELHLTNFGLQIRDNGIGIAPENLEKLFTPFFTTKEKGTGLGLSIVHKIIEDHHGSIDVSSQVGVGTTFNIHLPAVSEKTYLKVA
jgi:signal transduction histidine kinase